MLWRVAKRKSLVPLFLSTTQEHDGRGSCCLGGVLNSALPVSCTADLTSFVCVYLSVFKDCVCSMVVNMIVCVFMVSHLRLRLEALILRLSVWKKTKEDVFSLCAVQVSSALTCQLVIISLNKTKHGQSAKLHRLSVSSSNSLFSTVDCYSRCRITNMIILMSNKSFFTCGKMRNKLYQYVTFSPI